MPDLFNGDDSTAFVPKSDASQGTKEVSRQPRANYVRNMVQKPTGSFSSCHVQPCLGLDWHD